VQTRTVKAFVRKNPFVLQNTTLVQQLKQAGLLES
jgi:hypothetical protein